MLVDEVNAKMVACPLLASASVNIGCKGSHCMAWRWAEPNPQRPDDTHGRASKLGYCGLAGRPVDVEDAAAGDGLPPSAGAARRGLRSRG